MHMQRENTSVITSSLQLCEYEHSQQITAAALLSGHHSSMELAGQLGCIF